MRKIVSVWIGIVVIMGLSSNAMAYMASSSAYNAGNLWMAPYWEKGVSMSTFSLVLYPKEQGGTLTDACLVLSFSDDAGRCNGWDFARVSDGSAWSYFDVNTGNYIIPISQDGLTALNTKGELTFTLERLFGDFTFRSARLVAEESNPVPIPGAVWLFGSALLILFGWRRRQSLGGVRP